MSAFDGMIRGEAKRTRARRHSITPLSPPMPKDIIIAYILITLVAALFAFVGFQMLRVRAEVNGVYPEYSSFRADPRGYRILFETLSRLESVHVDPFEQPLTNFPSTPVNTLVIPRPQ